MRSRGYIGFAVVCLGLTLALVGNASARAHLTSVSGEGNILDPSVTATGATANFFQDPGNALVHGWDEKQGFTLSQDVYVDIVKSGSYDQNSDLGTFNQYKLAQGTVVDSHLLYFDPLKSDTVKQVTYTFSGPILGVIVESDRFYNQARSFTDYYLASDFLGNPLTIYPKSHFNNRGLELGSPDALSVDVTDHTVTLVILGAGSPGDQIRVLTAAVPEPASLAIAMGVGLLWGGYAGRRRRQA